MIFIRHSAHEKGKKTGHRVIFSCQKSKIRYNKRQEIKRQELEKHMRKMTIEEHYMKEAIRQAKKAAALKEVPIGCVIVYDGRIIARGYNRRTVDRKSVV